MTKHEQATNFSRRTLLKAGGALVVSIGAPVDVSIPRMRPTAPPQSRPNRR